MSRCHRAREPDVLCERASHSYIARSGPLSPVPNRAFIAARKEKGYGRSALAARVREWGRADDPDREPPSQDSVVKCIGRVERGEVTSPGEFYGPAFAAVLGVPVAELFGTDRIAAPAEAGSGFTVTSHQFAPVFIGADTVQQLANDPRFRRSELNGTPAWTSALDHPAGTGTVYLLGWGVAVFHLAQRLKLPSVAALATWRDRQHSTVPAATARRLAALLAQPTAREPDYTLSAYWVDEPGWSRDQLATAAHLICMPKVLLDRHIHDGEALLARAEVAERGYLRAGFTHPDVVEFGVPGVAIGCASWSGVVYVPLAPARALQQDELVSFEIVVQGLWCYCSEVFAAAESGTEDALPDEYGWRFLRSSRSRLTAAGPTDTGQVRMMQDAVLDTSRLVERLTQAQAMLRDPN